MTGTSLHLAARAALAALETLLTAEASQEEWQRVDHILETRVEDAIDRKDTDALGLAIRDIGDLTGWRAARVGQPPTGPPPPKVQDRVPKLVTKVGRLLPDSRA